MVFSFSGAFASLLFEEYGVADLFSASKPSNDPGLLTGFSGLDQILFQMQWCAEVFDVGFLEEYQRERILISLSAAFCMH
jgi:hypothetical protein